MTATARPEAPPPARPARRLPSGVLPAVLGVLGVLVLALAVGGAVGAPAPAGLPRAGAPVEWGLPVARLAARVTGIATVGTLLFAALLLPAPGGVLPGASLRAVRAAAAWAAAWAAATALTALLTVSDLLGVAPGGLTGTVLGTFLAGTPAGRAALTVVLLAVAVALLARRCRRTPASGALLLAALAGLVVPVVLTGHSAAAGDHVPAVTGLAVHVVAAAAWVGGLAALLVHGRAAGDLAPAAARYSAVALACSLLTGASGLLGAWLLLGGDLAGPAAAAGTGYGWLLLAKTAALVALGVLGWRHRRGTLPRLRAGEPGAFRRLAVAEVVLMAATVAVAVALSASPPPPGTPEAATGPAAAPAAPASPGTPAPTAAPDPMAGHDHGELSVGVLVDGERFHVPRPVAPGSRVTVFNSSDTEVTLTADDGGFDVVVPGHALLTFPAPGAPGEYGFTSRHDPGFRDVLVVAAP
ncbi:putative copper resistance protein D [Geodermatophilus dictyosporus]|uniref:Putative copper resistance protein D n=1 Tax=Geodermatophilus dictyosporus TaxID=1523247 RepID=A0A1I5JS14_9ACTN|nr:CopD family protein [Geodermatophilus dictyosporus]SFO75602.1 putative copper resistance protein D [Geodermatophilus dictyosporus]